MYTCNRTEVWFCRSLTTFITCFSRAWRVVVPRKTTVACGFISLTKHPCSFPKTISGVPLTYYCPIHELQLVKCVNICRLQCISLYSIVAIEPCSQAIPLVGYYWPTLPCITHHLLNDCFYFVGSLSPISQAASSDLPLSAQDRQVLPYASFLSL